MAAVIVAENTLYVGTETVVEGGSPSHRFRTLFEDDGGTGYFYGLDPDKEDNPIVDAVQIYNVASVADKDRPSRLQIAWSSDGLKSALLINRYVHAIFDFAAQRGYCRSNFPPPTEAWTSFSHQWSDEALTLFSE